MRQADAPPEEPAARVARLSVYEDRGPLDHARVRFAAEKIVADRPDAGFEEHVVLMRAKLDEARLLEKSLNGLPNVDSTVERAAEAAADALREARLEDVEVVLADAENLARDATVRISIRSARGEAALVRGDATQAAAHFAAAADYLWVDRHNPEITEVAMLFRSGAVCRLIRHADTFGGDGAWIGDAMELCYANVRLRDTSLWNQGARQMDAGAAQLSAGRLTDANKALDLFIGADCAFSIAAWLFDRDRSPKDWAAAQNARGVANARHCLRYEEATGRPVPARAWARAEDCYASAMEVRREAGESVQWAKTGINRGYLLLHRGVAEGGDSGQQHLRRSIDLCRSAQQALRSDVEADVWVDAQHILVETLLGLAEIDRDEAENHLSQAMAEMRLAQDVASREYPRLRVADRDRLLARLREMERGETRDPLDGDRLEPKSR